MNQSIPWPGWALVRFQGRGAGGQIYEIRKAGASASMTVVRIPRNPTETRALAEQGLSPEQIRAKYKNDLDILTRKFNQLTALGGTPGLVRCQALTAEPDGPGWQVFLRTELLTPLPGALTPEQTVRAGKELCRGVAALRQTLRGPLDIRSGNIFLAANGSFRLADFSVVPENGNFAPPEIQPPRVPGPEGDEYALGMVLYRMLNRGCGPFLTADSSGADHAVAEKARLQGVLLPDPAVGQPRLKDLVRKACHPDPAQRYASVGALTASLDFLSGSAAPRSSGPSGRTAPAVPKHRTHRTGKIIVLSVALALLVCLTAGGILWGLSRQTAQAPEATRPPHRPVHTEPTRTSQLLPVITEPAETLPPETEAPETISIETGPVDTETVGTEPSGPEPLTNAQVLSRSVIAAGKRHTAILLPDGTAVAAGSNGRGQCNVDYWSGLTMLCAGDSYTLGLQENGTVIATGDNDYGQCNVSSWSGIVSISAGDYHCAGLCSDGSVVVTGFNNRGQADGAALQNAVGSRTVCQVACGYEHTLALCTDGTVAAIGSNDYGQCNVQSWTDIVAIWAGTDHSVGLRSDGTVVAAGMDDNGQCLVSGWENIVSVTAGDYFTAGITRDGSVVFTGQNKRGQLSELGSWDHIRAIGGGCQHTVAIREDGTVLTSGWNEDGQCDLPRSYPLS